MRWFLSRTTPSVSRLLLVESGPRSVAEKVIPRLRKSFGETVRIDLLTCQLGDPVGLAAGNSGNARVWRATNHRNIDSRWELLCRIRYERHPVVVVLCAKSSIMLSWKLTILLVLPSKFIIANENADYFLLDRGHLPNLKSLLLHRVGLQPDLVVRLIVRALAFPFTLAYLLGYAVWVHSRRAVQSVFHSFD